MSENTLQLADIFRAGFQRYLAATGPLPPQHYNVVNAIMNCRTSALGGHVFRCDQCGSDRIVYNSCRNRHCPSCQGLASARWVEARTNELLPVAYFHVVFTVPRQLNPFALRNQKSFYNILFAAASQTIQALGADPRHLGALTGFIAVLHTWGQNLMDHPHLHLIMPGGGLDDDRWVPTANPAFLFPVKVMSALFRGKFLDAFKMAIDNEEIELVGSLESFRENPETLCAFFDKLYKLGWVVYAKPPFGGPKAVVKYLGRYTHRIAIANSRLISLNATHVSFQWKDYAHGNQFRVMTLTVEEFIRRFMLHVLPKGFVRIRYFGFLANGTRADRLQLCRDQTDPVRALAQDNECDDSNELSPVVQPPRIFPVCGMRTMVLFMELPKRMDPGVPTAIFDHAPDCCFPPKIPLPGSESPTLVSVPLQ